MANRSKGEGCFWHNDKLNRWVWRIQLKDLDGKPKIYSLSCQNRPELKQKVEKFLAEYAATRQPMREYIKLDEFVEYWLESIKPTIRQSTWDYYERLTRIHILPALGKIKIKDLTPLRIQEFLNSLKGQQQQIVKTKTISAATINSIRQTLIVLLNAAIDNNIINFNPANKTKRQKAEEKEKVIVDSEKLKEILAVARTKEYIYVDFEKSQETGKIEFYPEKFQFPENDGMVYNRHCFLMEITLAAFTGLRLGEILGLKWQYVNFERSELTVRYILSSQRVLTAPKTSKSVRKVLLDSSTLRLLQEWKQEQEKFAEKFHGNYVNKENLVFTNIFGGFVSIRNQRDSYWNKLMIAASVPPGFTFHSFRHTHATLLLKSGVDVKTVSERLGHASAMMTLNVYAHVLPSMQQAAVNAIENLRKE